MGREHAFTRIEGVIVVVILGVVAWIAIPGFLGHRHGCGFEAGAVGCLRELKIVNERQSLVNNGHFRVVCHRAIRFFLRTK